jgi:hypothetical protein
MNEQIIRIVVNTTEGELRQDPAGGFHPFTRPVIFQKGKPLPQPEGEPPEPLVVIDIQEVQNDAGDDYYLVYSVGEDKSIYQVNNIGFVTAVPADTVVRKDSQVPASEIFNELARLQAEALQMEEEDGADDDPAPPPAVMPPGLAAAPPQHPQTIAVGLPPEIAAMRPPPNASFATASLGVPQPPAASEQPDGNTDGTSA